MKRTFIALLVIISCLGASSVQAQKIKETDLKKLRRSEDSLKVFARYLITDSLQEDRMISDSVFTRVLVRALKTKNSFYYPFDSVLGISKLYAPDSTFRIITWNLQYDDFYSRQRGAIQFPTKDGSLKLLNLIDVSEFTMNPEDSVRGRMNWIGAVYYNITKTTHNGKNYYTLFGYENVNVRTSRKWIEVLTFNANNEPVFGGPLFYFGNSTKEPPKYRIALEYKKEARVLADFIDELGVILFDHLISETNEPDLKFTYVPDGDNEAFKWENGRWVHIDKAFDFKIDMSDADMYLGKPPVGDPILDRTGKENEKKLEEKSRKNKEREN